MKASGGCHCQAVRFVAELPSGACIVVQLLDLAATGYLHIMVPHEDFELVTGRDSLTSYRFGTGAAEHLFCATCGIKSFYQPRSHPGAWSINANCLDDPPELAVEQFDGRDWERAKANLDAPD